jgi:hypothetical protein
VAESRAVLESGPIDAETKERFDSLELALLRLTENQVRTNATVERMVLGLEQTNATVRELAVEMRALAEAQRRTDERMGWFAQHMLLVSTR